MNKTILDKIKGMKSTVSDDFNEVTKSVNSLTTDTYNTLSKSLDDVTNIKNKISVISDMFTDLRVLNGTAKNMVYLSTLPIVENSGIKVKDDKFTLDTLIKTNKEIYVKDSSISSVEKYKLYTLDGKGTVLDTFLKSGVETLVQFDNTRYTFTLNLKYTSMEQINSIELQLGLLTESYPIINSIKYVDKDNVEKTAVILNNTSTSYDLDYNREVDNKYTLDISPIFTNQINIELTSKTNSNVILKDIKTYFKKEVQVAEIIVGPIHTEKPLLKVALDCEELTKGCSFELSTDLDYWLKLDSSSIITDELNTKILSFNTINEKSIKTKEDIYTFYIKMSVESTLLTNDDVNTNIYNTLREDHSISNETLEIVDDNLFSAYKVKSSDFIHGKYQYIENLNLKDLSKENIEYIEVNGTSKVLGLVESPYSITDKSENNGGGIGGELKLKRLPADFLIDSTRYDLANAKVHDIFLRNTEETINTREKDNLCLTLKRKKILVVEPDFTAPYNVTATVTDEEDFSAPYDIEDTFTEPYDINSTIEENNENAIPTDEMYFTTTAGQISYLGNPGDVVTLSDGTTVTVLEDGTFSSENVPAGKHKVKLVTERSESYGTVGIDGEALVELHNFPLLESVIYFTFCPNTSSPNLVKVPNTLPSNLTSLSQMFYEATNFNQDLSSWDVSKVTEMIQVFHDARAFNQPLNSWDVSNVTDMSWMFSNTTNFNQPLSSWNVSNLTNMVGMFNGSESFNQPIGNWDVSNVTDMVQMFFDAEAFNQNISGWDVSNVEDMKYMFEGASSFNKPIGSWNVSKVTDMYGMFGKVTNFNQDLSSWDTSKVTDMGNMFYGASSFNQDLSQWCVGLITEEPDSFKYNSALTLENTPIWGTCPRGENQVTIPSNEIHFTTLAGSADYTGNQGDQILLSDGTILDITITYDPFTFNVPAGKHIVKLVESDDRSNYVSIGGEALVELHNFPTLSSVGTFDAYLSPNLVKVPTVFPSNITRLTGMFGGATSLNQDISMWDTSNVINIDYMFQNATAFNQPLGNWDVSNVTNMDNMFDSATSFNQDLTNWCVSSITSKPNGFNDGAPLFTTDKHPVWGTCPSGVSVPKDNEMEFTTTTGTIDYEGVVGDQIILSNGTTITLDQEYLYDIAVPAGKHRVVLKEPREATYVGVGGEGLIELHNFPTLSSIDSFNFYPNNASTNLVKVPTVLPPNIVYTVRMFSKASAFNQDISMWDTSNVKYMYYMFSDATSFNQPLNTWDTSNVLDMIYMFRGATNFNQPIGTWDTSNVEYMQYMFRLSTSFAQDLSQWCVPSMTSKPISFDDSAPLFTVDKHPVWGTCPRGENLT